MFPHTALYRWYDQHGRKDLPWRTTRDPYHIYVSEVMLQQTQVHTVLHRYYHPFLERFPSLTALADAPLEQALKAWEGLGYYRRIRMMHQAAQMTAPTLPTSAEHLMQLSGIGRNTAHAIAAFAYHHPVPVMEANVKRVLHRLYAAPKLSERQLWDYAHQCLDATDPFTYNQAMMDIGALICTPKNPLCTQCPLASSCQGKAQPHAYPAPKPRKTIPIRTFITLVVEADRHYYLAPRTSDFLGGLFGFMHYECDAPLLVHGTLYDRSTLPSLGWFTQHYSHFIAHTEVLHLALAARPSGEGWYNKEQINALPLSRLDSKIFKQIAPNPRSSTVSPYLHNHASVR
ncbi:MAG: A/G-specific adenine glycosylase [Alphaproteobacteria bacterium]|nr:MAG: A/G-specific adenine glycosylase [Alphaproteobacteria bacterium]